MKIRTPNNKYLKEAEKLTKEQKERLLSRMRGKLTRKLESEKLNPIEAIALQLEAEDEDLVEWRKQRNEIKDKEKSRKKS